MLELLESIAHFLKLVFLAIPRLLCVDLITQSDRLLVVEGLHSGNSRFVCIVHISVEHQVLVD